MGQKKAEEIVCGIIGYVGSRSVVPVLLEGLKKLEYRGYDSAGIALVHGEEIQIRRVNGKISALEKSLNASPLEGSYGIGHTRWATHGRPSEENAHPHRDCTGTVVVAHNGIIENYLALKKTLKEEGHEFLTETDSEIIAHLIEKYNEGSLEKAVQRALLEIEGAYAIAVLSLKDPGKIVTAKMGPPVVVGLGEKENFVSSDINPLLSYTQKIVFLGDGEMAVIEDREARFCDFSGKPLEKEINQISWNPLLVEKRGFKHFMLKEIFEQPQVVRDTLEGRIALDTGEVRLKETGLIAENLKKISRVTIIACGTSYHAGLVGKCFIETLAGLPATVEYASEFRYQDFILDRESLVIVVSQSGETADTLAALRAVKAKTSLTLAICNAANSSIAREAGGVLYTHAGPEIGVAATKTFSAQMTALALLALALAQARGKLDKNSSLELIQNLQRIPHRMEQILTQTNMVEDLAHQFSSFSHFLYLGRWVSFPVALEGALKLKEISYIHAEGCAGGEMKHGPIALIDENMPTLAVVPKDKVYDKMLSNISEIKTRKGAVVAVVFEDDEDIRGKADFVIPIPRAHPLFTPFLTTIPLQLFAYHIASMKGADVDQPRNLAKSVTVE